MKTTTKEVKTLDVQLGGRSRLRICLTKDHHGEPESLVLSRGFGSGPDFHRPMFESLPLMLPPSALPQVIEALQALQEATEP